MDRLNPRTNGKSIVTETKSLKEANRYTLTKREKQKNIYVYLKKGESKQINKQIYQ